MVSTNTLELFAKQAAIDYLKDKKSLNESIIKIASDNGLNREQIARVVEAANTDVYINLFNKSNDKYVQYEVADPAVIQSNLSNTKVAEVSDDASDYYDAPGYETPEIVPIEKTSELKEQPTDNTISNETLKDYYRFKAAEANLTGLLIEGQQLFAQESSHLCAMIKQAVLGGTSYNDICTALSINNDPVFTETLKAIEVELTPNMPIGSLTKTATTLTHPVNVKHPLVQQSLKLVKIANEYKTVQEKLEQLNQEWAMYKISGIMNVAKNILKHPFVFGTGAAVGIGGTALAMPAIAKESVKREQNVMNNIPVRYKS
jgi:hypothetical protein